MANKTVALFTACELFFARKQQSGKSLLSNVEKGSKLIIHLQKVWLYLDVSVSVDGNEPALTPQTICPMIRISPIIMLWDQWEDLPVAT